MHPLCILWQLQIDKQNIETNPIFFCKFVHAHICACTQLSCPYECGLGTWHAAAGNTTAAEAPAATLPRWLSHHDQQPSAETSVQPVLQSASCLLILQHQFPRESAFWEVLSKEHSGPDMPAEIWEMHLTLLNHWQYAAAAIKIHPNLLLEGFKSSRLSVGRYKSAQELLRVSGRPLEPHRQYLGSPTHCYWSQLGNQTTPSNKGPSSPRRPTWRPEVLLPSITLCQPSSRVFVSHQVSWNCRKFQPADK